jgi:hypothetical protein
MSTPTCALLCIAIRGTKLDAVSFNFYALAMRSPLMVLEFRFPDESGTATFKITFELLRKVLVYAVNVIKHILDILKGLRAFRALMVLEVVPLRPCYRPGASRRRNTRRWRIVERGTHTL